MRVFVTGGAGYIGTKVIDKLLQNKIQVRCWDNLTFGLSPLSDFLNHPLFELEKWDITEHKRLQAYMLDCDVCIHLAALVFQGGEEIKNQIMEVNYNATKHIADICRNMGIKFIFTSTCSNYGTTKDLVNEESDLQINSPYSESKIKAEKYIMNNFPETTILRLSTAFGLSEKMRFDLIVNEMTRDAVMKKEIKVFNPDAWRPGLHLDDISDVIFNCIEKDLPGVYNVGHESMNYQKKKLVNILQNSIPGLKVNTVKKGDVRDYKVSFEKIKNALGFYPKRTLEYGVFEISKALHIGLFDDPYDKKYQNLEVYKNG